MITYKSNKYSVCKELVGKQVQYVVRNESLYIYYNENYVCCHKISKEKLNYTDNHFEQNQDRCFNQHNNNVQAKQSYNSNEQQSLKNFEQLAHIGEVSNVG